jgi:uncharacterized membrane protein
MEFTPIVLIHTLAASGALVLGGLTLALKKGTPAHRILGRTWVALMLTAALVSFGIKTSGHFSWIHLLSVVTVFSLTASVYAAMKGNIRSHLRGMTATYICLVIAGAFTLLPDRRLGYLIWHAAGLI